MNAVPSEYQEQKALVQWADLMAKTAPWWPAGAVLVHVPNGEARNAVTGARLRSLGVRPGFPDLMLLVPRQGFGGLFIEMKRRVGGHVAPEQKAWHRELISQGYKVTVCHGFDAARAEITEYLGGKE